MDNSEELGDPLELDGLLTNMQNKIRYEGKAERELISSMSLYSCR